MGWPYRRQAGSHRYITALENRGVPVGAGLPAMGPVPTTQLAQSLLHPPYNQPPWSTAINPGTP